MTAKPHRSMKERWGALRMRMHLNPKRRRQVIAVSAVLVLVVLVGVVPGYVAAQPKFLGGYSEFDSEYQTWSKSVHAQVACNKCHVAPAIPHQAVYNVKMLGEFYARVLPAREPNVLGTPSNSACQSCHLDLRTVSASGDLKIPHRAHVQVLKIPCVECHEFLVHESSPEGKHTPTMRKCLECHDGKTAKNSCATCHTEKATPKSHKAADWRFIHASKQKEEDCKKCHNWKKDWCKDCHSRRPTSHNAKWRGEHQHQVEEHRSCEACHDAKFCIKCHGEVPQKNFNPDLDLVK